MIMSGDDHDDLHLDLHRAVDELGKYAIVINVRSEGGVSKEEVLRFVNHIMKRSVQVCMENGADIVGHVKSFVWSSEGNIMGSIVDAAQEKVAFKDALPVGSLKEFEFTMHVIVHGIWDDMVRDLTRSILDEVFADYDMDFEIVDDHYEVEKGMDHH